MQRKDIYPGIDLVLYGSEGHLEYDFVLAPGADPGRIAMRFQGARALRIATNGDLIVSTDSGELVQRKPYLYQDRPVEGHYRIAGPDRVVFEVGAYDPARVLTIDPVLESLTLLGGSSDDRVAFADPRIAIIGSTRSADFPGRWGSAASRHRYLRLLTGFPVHLHHRRLGRRYCHLRFHLPHLRVRSAVDHRWLYELAGFSGNRSQRIRV